MRDVLFYDYNPIPTKLGENLTVAKAASLDAARKVDAYLKNKNMPKAAFSESVMLVDNKNAKATKEYAEQKRVSSGPFPKAEPVAKSDGDGWIHWIRGGPWPFESNIVVRFRTRLRARDSLHVYTKEQMCARCMNEYYLKPA